MKLSQLRNIVEKSKSETTTASAIAGKTQPLFSVPVKRTNGTIDSMGHNKTGKKKNGQK